ncbi:MAG TPA: ABC transporter permease [Candidatus Limnocylindria bacterium]|jgi:putative ABC transport system permease protein|nr:ABC transporter permease [Candidatus Limnocylindria bacterium]
MNFLTNLRYTFRQITNNPGFFALAVAALALGIGANTAIFSAVEAVLLRSLPYSQPDRLAVVWEDASFIGFAFNTPAPANYLDWRARNQVFTDMLATRFVTASLTGDGQPEQLSGKKVTPNFFDVLGVQPVAGRPFTVEEDNAQTPVVVLSYNLWRRRFGGDEAIIGREILLNGVQTKVVGAMPKDFFFGDRKNSDYWVPMAFTPEQWARRQSHFLTVVARLKPGVTTQQAQTDMERIALNLQKQYPESNAKVGAVVVPIQKDFAGDARSGLLVLQVASLFVLLIACSNLANLLLARSTGRRREIAVRLAMGASRWQIASQLLTESLALSAAGGFLGLWVGQMCWSVFGQLVPEQAGDGFAVNGPLLLFNAGISIAAGMLFGFAPALRATRVPLQESLKDGGRGGESRGGLRLRDTLVVGQFALAFALLVCAGLMIQTIWNLRKQELGFQADHLLTMGVPLPEKKYDTDEKVRGFFHAVEENVRALPGVKGAGFGSDAPFMTNGDTEGYTVEGQPPLPTGEYNDALYREVTPGYLEMLGARVKEGRLLDESDHEGGALAVVVNEFLASRHWPGKSAVGKRIRFGGEKEPWWAVVGVVRDIRERGLLYEMKPAVYVPVTQVKKPGGFSMLVVRTSNEPQNTIKMVEDAVWSVDPQQPVSYVRTMDQLMETDVADRTRPMILLGVFAGLALVLACIGVYGVLAYAVAQRTREIGVRMALGAKPVDVTRMILGRGMKLSAIGLLAGGALAAGLAVLLRTLLFGVTLVAPGIYAGTAAALVIVALAACVIPAQRASRVDPAVALRNE